LTQYLDIQDSWIMFAVSLSNTKNNVLRMANKSQKLERKRDDVASTVALIHGVTPDYVRKVRRGDRNDEPILNSIMDIIEGRTKLLQEVKELVKLDENTAKRDRKQPEKGVTFTLFDEQTGKESEY
jgi:hypothetical protein